VSPERRKTLGEERLARSLRELLDALDIETLDKLKKSKHRVVAGQAMLTLDYYHEAGKYREIAATIRCQACGGAGATWDDHKGRRTCRDCGGDRVQFERRP